MMNFRRVSGENSISSSSSAFSFGAPPPPPPAKTDECHFFETNVTPSRCGHMPQFYPEVCCSSNHYQLCQNLCVDETDPECLAGNRIYMVVGHAIVAIDLLKQKQIHLHRKRRGTNHFQSFPALECNFRPLNVHAKHKMLALCGNGDRLMLIDAYTGELLFNRLSSGGHLTNTIRILRPPVPETTACEADFVGPDEMEEILKSNDLSDATLTYNTGNTVRAKKILLGSINESEEKSKKKRKITAPFVAERMSTEPLLHLLVGGNNAGISVYSVTHNGLKVADIAFPTYINEIRVSPDLTRFVALGDTDDIFMASITTNVAGDVIYQRTCKREFHPVAPEDTHGPGGFSAAWSGDKLACLRENPGTINLLNANTLELLASFTTGDDDEQLRVVAFDGDLLIFAERGGNVHVVDTAVLDQQPSSDPPTFTRRQLINANQLARELVASLRHNRPVVFDCALDQEQSLHALSMVPEHQALLSDAEREFAQYVCQRDSTRRMYTLVSSASDAPTHDTVLQSASPLSVNRCTGMVVVPGTAESGRKLFFATPSLFVLSERKPLSLMSLSFKEIIEERRICNENIRRKALYSFFERLLRAAVRFHNMQFNEKASEKASAKVSFEEEEEDFEQRAALHENDNLFSSFTDNDDAEEVFADLLDEQRRTLRDLGEIHHVAGSLLPDLSDRHWKGGELPDDFVRFFRERERSGMAMLVLVLDMRWMLVTDMTRNTMYLSSTELATWASEDRKRAKTERNCSNLKALCVAARLDSSGDEQSGPLPHRHGNRTGLHQYKRELFSATLLKAELRSMFPDHDADVASDASLLAPFFLPLDESAPAHDLVTDRSALLDIERMLECLPSLDSYLLPQRCDADNWKKLHPSLLQAVEASAEKVDTIAPTLEVETSEHFDDTVRDSGTYWFF